MQVPSRDRQVSVYPATSGFSGPVLSLFVSPPSAAFPSWPDPVAWDDVIMQTWTFSELLSREGTVRELTILYGR